MQPEYLPRRGAAWQFGGMTGLLLRAAGLLLCAAAWWRLSAEGQAKGVPGGMPLILAAHGALIVGAILLAKPLAGCLGDLLANLFMPDERHARPQPMYSIPEGRLAAGDCNGALEAYAELAAAHPREIVPHLRMMEIVRRAGGDAGEVRRVRDRALVAIKGRGNRKRFAAAARVLLDEHGAETRLIRVGRGGGR
jgi:hypothetical protein